MSKKEPGPKAAGKIPSGKARSGDGAALVFAGFSDGSKVSMPLAQATALMLRQYLAMEQSEDPAVSAAGRAAFDRAVYLLVATQVKPIVDGGNRTRASIEARLRQKEQTELDIRREYAELPVPKRGREATGIIARHLGKSENTVKQYLDKIRAEEKPQ